MECPKCLKQNDDAYRFCLGCGAELQKKEEEKKQQARPCPVCTRDCTGMRWCFGCGHDLGDPEANPEVERLLVELDVYVKYGLLDKAREHLARVLPLAPPGHAGVALRKAQLAEKEEKEEKQQPPPPPPPVSSSGRRSPFARDDGTLLCPNCGRVNAPNFNFCLDCGYDFRAAHEEYFASQPSESWACETCGYTNAIGVRFCGNCGQRAPA